jgi:pyridoxamine 5'-phosphate oxidase
MAALRRIVLLKGVENGQLVFYTNYLSRKGKQLAANPFVSITFFWPELERQVRMEGRVQQVAPRCPTPILPAVPMPAGWVPGPASRARNQLQERADQPRRHVWRQHPLHVPRPPHWGGYAVIPDRWSSGRAAPAVCTTAAHLLQADASWQRCDWHP